MRTLTKTLSSLALSVALVAATVPIPSMAAPFTDTSGHWAQQAIENLSQKGILTGYPTGEFRPEGRVTRAEFATMLVKAQNLGNRFEDNGSNFIDVPRSFWAYQPIEIVSDKGLVSGYPGGYFKPGQSISRAEAMAILASVAGAPFPTQAEASSILRDFSDSHQVPQWAERAVAAAVQSGIFTNFPSSGLIEPNRPATRAEVAMMTQQLQDYQVARLRPPAAPAMGANPEGPWNTPPSTTGSISQQNALIKGQVSMVPARTVFTGVVTQPISSDRSQVGDGVALTLDRPMLSPAGEIVIPQGSQVLGAITRIEPAGRGEKNAGIVFDFDRVRMPDGKVFPLSAEINTEQGILVGGTTKGRVARVAGRTVGGAAIGGVAGAAIGRITGGKKRTDEGLLWGSIIGSGLGAASAVASKGKEVIVEPGEALELRLRQPLTVTSP